MRKVAVITWMLACSSVAMTQEHRDLDAHEHGVGTLNIAIEGNEIAMELRAPGADIVGFEHPAETDEDRRLVDTAIVTLGSPGNVLSINEDAQCKTSAAEAELHGDSKHHDDHDDDHHGDDHDDHDKPGHTEFHAEYAFSCAAGDQIQQIEFGYFAAFPNARKLAVQLISDRGSMGFEVTSDNPVLDLQGAH